MSLLRDYRNQISWGRVCAAVALIVAIVGQFNGMDVEHLKVWIAVVGGNYGFSKIAEMIGNRNA